MLFSLLIYSLFIFSMSFPSKVSELSGDLDSRYLLSDMINKLINSVSIRISLWHTSTTVYTNQFFD